MQDEEEQPIAVAFVEGPGDSILTELVFDQDLFWGIIYQNLQTRLTVAELEARNKNRFQATLAAYSPLPFHLNYIICQYLPVTLQ